MVTMGAVVLMVGGLGVATAADGGSLVLGHHNSATTVTSLANSKGTALALKAKKGKPALSVNTPVQIKHLNSSLLDGSTAGALKTTGSAAATNYGYSKSNTVSNSASTVASTAKLSKGTYYVVATAAVGVPPGHSGRCGVTTADVSTLVGQLYEAEGSADTDSASTTLTSVLAVPVTKGQTIKEYCWLTGLSGFLNISYAAITAIRVDSSTTGTFPPGQSND